MEAFLARFRMMYWKEIPVQVQAQDEDGQVSVPLEPRFQEAADAVAMFDGSAGTDAYLDGWGFGEFIEREGSAAEVAAGVSAQFNSGMPADFVAQIRDLHRAGNRIETPGAIDSWANFEPA